MEAQDLTHEELPGTAEHQNKVRIIREEKEAAKNKAEIEKDCSKSFYTSKKTPKMNGGGQPFLVEKVLHISVSQKGAFSNYIGRADRIPNYDVMLKQWKKDGVWVAESEYEETISKARLDMQKKYEKLTAKSA